MSLSIVGSNISHYMQFKSSIKTNHIKYDFARAKENITFPNLELCNYQSHSRQLVKEKYPMFNSTTMRLLYTDDFDPKMDISAIDGVNLSQFAIDTAPRISFLVRIYQIDILSMYLLGVSNRWHKLYHKMETRPYPAWRVFSTEHA